ncbi:MAG TPA: hypothetical protein VLD65_11320 [Anaerolineales bacterium]|nr:hypothetical protein [Anaerolineales bacterium]
MDVYKLHDRRQNFLSSAYPGHLGREGQRHFGVQNQTVSRSLRHYGSPSSTYPTMTVPDTVRIYEDYQGCFSLETDMPTALRSINESKMSTIVRQSLNRSNFRIQGWRARKLEVVGGNPVSMGIYRFEGVGSERNEWLDWSILLKIIQSPANLGYDDYGEGQDQAHWNYWKRELLLYQSGWLQTLPEGFRAPVCYDAVETPGNIGGIWLEDVRDSFAGNWPLHRYALAARHLGRLNGIYISRRELPDFPWLSRQRTRQWMKTVAWRDFPWDHPLVWQQFPNPGLDNFRTMLEESERFFARLDQLPKTISHGDTDPINFISRRLPRNQEQTVAMNWSQAGIEPIGDDLGQLVYGTYKALKGYKLRDISETLFTSYINGLQDSGCRVDAQLVRFGFVASAAFRMGLSKMVRLEGQLKREEDSIPQHSAHPFLAEPFESYMASEAYRLLDGI